MFRFVILLAAVLASAHSQTAVSQCRNNPGALPISTHIEGCTNQPCVLPQLRDAVIHVSFRAPRAIQSMRTLAVAYVVAGNTVLTVPYDLQQYADTCRHLTNGNCPLQSGQVVTYTMRMRIQPFFPVGTIATVEFRVVDQANAPVWCIRTDIRISAPRTTSDDVLVADAVEQVQI